MIDPIITEYRHGKTDYYADLIIKEGTKDQSRTSVVLNAAYGSVYQPYYLKRDDFEDIRKELVRHIQDKFLGKDYWISRDVWGLNYLNGEGAAPHVHSNVDYSMIWYLNADEDCGTLEFFNPDQSVQPTKNMLVLFDGRHKHGVLPSIDPDAKRTCMVFSIHKLENISKHNNHRGFYTLDD